MRFAAVLALYGLVAVAAAYTGSITPADAAVASGVCSTSGSGSMLKRAADGLSAGEWCEMSVNFGGSYRSFWAGQQDCSSSTDLLCGASSGMKNIVTYANKMIWDPVRKEIRYSAWTHGGGENKFIIYDDATNTWDTGPDSPASYGHGYDENTVDPSTGFNYLRKYNGTTIWRYNGSSWSTYDNTYSWPTACCGCLAWFPERGKLIASMGRHRVAEFDGASWSLISDSLAYDQQYESGCTYNPVDGVVWLWDGRGNENWEYDRNGNLTSLADAPMTLGTEAANVVVDPVSGDYIMWDGSNWRTFDISARSWGTISHDMPPMRSDNNKHVVNVAISDYGVIVYLSAYSDAMFVYKHAASTVTSPPPIPQDLAAQ